MVEHRCQFQPDSASVSAIRGSLRGAAWLLGCGHLGCRTFACSALPALRSLYQIATSFAELMTKLLCCSVRLKPPSRVGSPPYSPPPASTAVAGVGANMAAPVHHPHPLQAQLSFTVDDFMKQYGVELPPDEGDVFGATSVDPQSESDSDSGSSDHSGSGNSVILVPPSSASQPHTWDQVVVKGCQDYGLAYLKDMNDGASAGSDAQAPRSRGFLVALGSATTPPVACRLSLWLLCEKLELRTTPVPWQKPSASGGTVGPSREAFDLSWRF
ncbi:unnamed protein product [Cyprideis torosa]|uniref:Uncharacterized protein n=1 Tax=Cyprideis torosa TaxID=163714 RepID=A0A7R8W777_9CRUS|nr:unnamed protein product [Cyprideis torosa]CAG0884903.1 unnamed protein product [Cyprideis torosa]